MCAAIFAASSFTKTDDRKLSSHLLKQMNNMDLRILRILVAVLMCLNVTSGQCAKKVSDINIHRANMEVNGDSVLNFVVSPWRCVLLDGKRDTIYTVYYNREGRLVAKIGLDGYKCGYGLGKNGEDYYDKWYTVRGERYHSVGWCNGSELSKGPKDDVPYKYGRKELDKHGNWTMAVYAWSDRGYVRELTYFDESGYDPEEEQRVEEMLAELKTTVEATKEKERSDEMIEEIFVGTAKVLFVLLLVMVGFTVFRRNAVFDWIDNLADGCITPRWGFFNLLQLAGLIPTLCILGPFLKVALLGDSDYPADLVLRHTLFGIGFACLYCVVYLLLRGMKKSYRRAIVEIVFAMVSCMAVLALLVFSILLCLAFIALLFIIAPFGSSSSRSSSGSSSGGHKESKCCHNCVYYDISNHWCKYHGKEMDYYDKACYMCG